MGIWESVIGGAISAVGNIIGADKSASSASENADKNNSYWSSPRPQR